ncbi:MAG TPA: phosphohistidine phosphatase SixA [Rubrobacteraceae bacterium]|nr:phosphohistidine phosphatase SixA [Rubrobacteraceae bacterium]
MEIYLVRHAAAAQRDPDRWPDDSDRPLTPEGENEFRLAARGLARVVPRVDAILSSPFQRAWRTAEILSELDSWPAPGSAPVLEPTLPPEKAALALEDRADSVAVVGHRPGLHELAAYLLTGSAEGLEIELEKGGVACIGFDTASAPGTGKLRWLLTPELLRAIAVS